MIKTTVTRGRAVAGSLFNETGRRYAFAFFVVLGVVLLATSSIYYQRTLIAIKHTQAAQQHTQVEQRHLIARLEATTKQQRKQLRASCHFDRDIGGLPPTIPPGGTKPTKVGVSILFDLVLAFRQAGCPGNLTPDPSLEKWATFYGLNKEGASQ